MQEDIATLKDEVKVLREKIEDLSDIVDEIIRNLESAFPKDEENNTDYIGHRQFHRKALRREKEEIETKAALKKNILTWASIGILSIIASSFAQAYITPVLNLIK